MLASLQLLSAGARLQIHHPNQHFEFLTHPVLWSVKLRVRTGLTVLQMQEL